MPDAKLFLSRDALVSREPTATSVGWTSDSGLLGDDPPGGWTQKLLLLWLMSLCSEGPMTSHDWLGFSEVRGQRRPVSLLTALFSQSKGHSSEMHDGSKQTRLPLENNLSLIYQVELSLRGKCQI